MAAAAHSTIASLPPRPDDAEVAKAVHGWEDDIGDLCSMADLLNVVVDALLSNRGGAKLTERECSRIMFCAYEVTARVGQIRQAYYAAVDGSEEGCV